MKKLTITIGIPVYNEEKNILPLVESIKRQKTNECKIEKIIISSDGSSDDTNNILKKIDGGKIKAILNSDRKGISRGLNQIIKYTDSDILVTLDADIFIKDNDFIQNLVEPILSRGVDHTSSSIKDCLNLNYFSKMLSNSMKLKEILFKNFKNGDNIYNCHGLARGYSRKLYKKLVFPISIGNDMYSYLYVVSNKYKFEYVSKSVAYYKLPSNIKDHFKQSFRFFSIRNSISNYFEKSMINEQLNITYKEYFKSVIESIPLIIQNPILTLLYVLVDFTVLLATRFYKLNSQTWDMAYSTK